MEADRIRIAFVSRHDARDKNVSSGAPYFMAQALRKHIGEVDIVTLSGPFRILARLLFLFFAVLNKAALFLFHRRYYKFNTVLARLYGFAFTRLLEGKRYDLIFSPKGSNEIAYLKTGIPIVYASDATFSLMIDYYPEFTGLCALSRRAGDTIERRAIRNASLCVYHCRWAADSAVRDYGADPEKACFTMPGANIESEFLPPFRLIAKKPVREEITLLFIGANWDRKGGQIAYDTMTALNVLGRRAEITICGCEVPERVAEDERVRHIRYLSKNDPEQNRRLHDLYMEADWFILPTRMECLATVLLEAAAFGVPCIGADTGGLKDAIIDGVTGCLMAYDACGREYAERIIACYEDGSYAGLRLSARRFYEERANWDSWAVSLNESLRLRGLPHAAPRHVAG
jgi:glycosyltransferase involved in cell wall biosynthesis